MPSEEITIRTNNVPRLVVDDYELTDKEQAEFDYIDWDAIKRGEDSATFVRYKNRLYDISEFQTTDPLPDFNPLRKWEGYLSDSFFSGIVIRFCQDMDYVIVGTFYA